MSFGLTLWKRRDGDDNRVLLIREVPPGDAEAFLLREMHKGLDHKHEKLAGYRAAGSVSVLVLESAVVSLSHGP